MESIPKFRIGWTTYMAYNQNLAKRIGQTLAGHKDIKEKKMFGGVGFLMNGNMLVGVWKDSLIVRLGAQEGPVALLEPHVKVFDITGRAMKGWVMVAPEGIEDGDQLKEWIGRALKFVRTLPAK
jgi:TfoX/Sxy family transcriptional regulator of competence genes